MNIYSNFLAYYNYVVSNKNSNDPAYQETLKQQNAILDYSKIKNIVSSKNCCLTSYMWGHDSGYEFFVHTPVNYGEYGYIRKEDLPEGYFALTGDFNKDTLHDKTKMTDRLLLRAGRRLFMKPSITPEELLYNVLIDYERFCPKNAENKKHYLYTPDEQPQLLYSIVVFLFLSNRDALYKQLDVTKCIAAARNAKKFDGKYAPYVKKADRDKVKKLTIDDIIKRHYNRKCNDNSNAKAAKVTLERFLEWKNEYIKKNAGKHDVVIELIQTLYDESLSDNANYNKYISYIEKESYKYKVSKKTYLKYLKSIKTSDNKQVNIEKIELEEHKDMEGLVYKILQQENHELHECGIFATTEEKYQEIIDYINKVNKKISELEEELKRTTQEQNNESKLTVNGKDIVFDGTFYEDYKIIIIDRNRFYDTCERLNNIAENDKKRQAKYEQLETKCEQQETQIEQLQANYTQAATTWGIEKEQYLNVIEKQRLQLSNGTAETTA